MAGNGSYSTPSGYTLPTSGATLGVYQWDATYQGDGNNYSASDNNDPAEQVSVLAIPTVINPTFTSVTQTSATLGGNVTSNGGASLSQRGIVYSLSSKNTHPVVGGPYVMEVDDPSQITGIFADLVGGLTKTTAYSFAAFATNSVGTGYSPVSQFVTAPATFIAGPTTGRPGQPATFTFYASDPSSTLQAYYFTFQINWGDGSKLTLSNLSGTTFAHTYAKAGTYTISAAATDGANITLPTGTWTITIAAPVLPGAASGSGGPASTLTSPASSGKSAGLPLSAAPLIVGSLANPSQFTNADSSSPLPIRPLSSNGSSLLQSLGNALPGVGLNLSWVNNGTKAASHAAVDSLFSSTDSDWFAIDNGSPFQGPM